MGKRESEPASSQPPVVRCAIYTRKSTEENLELDFNSLDAQREAAEAYIASQKHAGWTCLADRYDDGGFSGGTVDRPAFRRLMADVEAGRVGCIVVYKIDRLSRSLMDFAKIMEVLDRQNVSLVSVTQQFNTTTSMGRLTLNILLSFAQFEREIISERTRDKIAAARRKGKWTGGHPVLGYDVVRDVRGTRLVVNEPEAQRVREIFAKYLKAGSILATVKWLNGRSWRNKSFTTAGGKVSGGKEFDKATLFKLLTNVIYLGKITYAGQAYAGEHTAIVDEDLFGRVQGLLAHNRGSGGKHQRNKYGAMLKGLVRCRHCGCGMMHHYTLKKGRRYRYYVCVNAQKRGWSACPYPSLPAGDLERFVIEQIRGVCSDPDLLKDVVQQAVRQIEHQIEGVRQTRARYESRVRRINEELCELARTPQAPGVSAELARLQEDLQKAEALLLESNQQIAALEQRKVDEDELTGAFEAFDPMWDRMRPDERARLIHLLVQCVEYDGEHEEISITYHPGGFDAVRQMEVTA
ncbi:MAG: recombinase family protein [Phycisphaeraceae bacterium]|nr:recombinase family protein [Phycisphaeraceae bacterium]